MEHLFVLIKGVIRIEFDFDLLFLSFCATWWWCLRRLGDFGRNLLRDNLCFCLGLCWFRFCRSWVFSRISLNTTHLKKHLSALLNDGFAHIDEFCQQILLPFLQGFDFLSTLRVELTALCLELFKQRKDGPILRTNLLVAAFNHDTDFLVLLSDLGLFLLNPRAYVLEVVDFLKHSLARTLDFGGFLQNLLVVFVLLVVVPLFFLLWLSHGLNNLNQNEVGWHVLVKVVYLLLALTDRTLYDVIVCLCYVHQALLAELRVPASEHLGHFELVRQVELL